MRETHLTSRRVRSVLWVTAVHVLTTAVLLLVFNVLLGSAFIRMVIDADPMTLVSYLAIGWLSAWLSTKYSAVYLRETIILSSPRTTLATSVATFSALVLTMLIVYLAILHGRGAMSASTFATEIAFAGMMIAAFYFETRRAFRQIPCDQPGGFEVIPARSGEER